ncbi:hypothetical protein MA16_Dca015821 [Dendrobium catenatum]|uniref:Uncharacterized protein n=1 Tax=Dendrobium catenatum TaxID=906689 RepID=A0A2I0X0H5_9ASPA|nr:hypothetical protein MA16_Dca015821 [Dendrobium catenatum]
MAAILQGEVDDNKGEHASKRSRRRSWRQPAFSLSLSMQKAQAKYCHHPSSTKPKTFASAKGSEIRRASDLDSPRRCDVAWRFAIETERRVFRFRGKEKKLGIRK